MVQESGVFDLLVVNNPRPSLRDVVRNTGRKGLYLLPGNKRTASAQTLLTIEGYDKTALAQILGEPRFNSGRLHYVILDTAPSAGGLQEMALYAADIVILPAAVDYLSLEGVAQILGTLKTLERLQPPVVRVLPTFYDEVTRESAANLTELRKQFVQMVLEPIHRAVALRECPPLGKTVFEHKPDSRAATEYASVVWEVINVSRGQ